MPTDLSLSPLSFLIPNKPNPDPNSNPTKQPLPWWEPGGDRFLTRISDPWRPTIDQALVAFEIVWTVGVVWMVFLQWPVHLRMHFWRRSPLSTADFVRVWTPSAAAVVVSSAGEDVNHLRSFLSKTELRLNAFFAAVYSDVTLPKEAGHWEICPVHDSAAGERFVTHRLRQLVYSATVNAFVPVKCALPTTVVGLLGASGGLSSSEAALRLARVGPNVIKVSLA